jgi:hypothetical protein
MPKITPSIPITNWFNTLGLPTPTQHEIMAHFPKLINASILENNNTYILLDKHLDITAHLSINKQTQPITETLLQVLTTVNTTNTNITICEIHHYTGTKTNTPIDVTDTTIHRPEYNIIMLYDATKCDFRLIYR